MVDVKISVIGAGSAVFSMSLSKDLCLTPSLSGSTVSLMDVNEERLNAVYAICRKYAEETGSRLRIEKTLNRRESLREADFVVNTALTAGYSRLREGWSIARRWGYRFGGSLHIMHDEAFWINFYQLRFFDSLMEDILEECPEAWHIQLANPVLAGVTYLGRKHSGVKTIGLCHGFSGVYRIASLLGLDAEKICFETPGVNHFIWLTSLTYEGKDVLPLLDEWIAREAGKHFEKVGFSSDVGPKAFRPLQEVRSFPGWRHLYSRRRLMAMVVPYGCGNRERLLELVEMDPWTRSEEQARGLLNDILSIPYHEEMRQHYK
ncbi:MAG: hypothetical protein QXU11_04970 [Thermoproteota archaeon]